MSKLIGNQEFDGNVYIKNVGTYTGSNATSGTNDIATVIGTKQDALTSGTNIKTVNSTSLLGSGNVDVKDIFWVTYDSTTFAEITAAINAGKIPICIHGGTHICVLSYKDDGEEYYFCCVDGVDSIKYLTLTAADDWNDYTYYLQQQLSSGTTIKTVNNTSLLGSGNVAVQPTLVSGTNIKSINNTSLLGSGNIDTKEIFWVTYGTTTYAQITAALNASKLPICIYTTQDDVEYVCVLCNNDPRGNYYYFCAFDGIYDGAYLTVDGSDNTWTYEQIHIQEKLTSGTTIKTVNNTSLLGSGNVSVGTYSKPSGGIPKTDLESAVQTSLGKADTALQGTGVTNLVVLTRAQYVALESKDPNVLYFVTQNS